MLQTRGRARLGIRVADIGAELPPRAVKQRLAVALVRRDDINESAHCVRAVEQRRRTAHDLDPLGPVRVDGDTVVAGLAGQVAGADPVLQDEHPVAVEAADDRAARSGAEAAARDARLTLQGVAEAAGPMPRRCQRSRGWRQR